MTGAAARAAPVAVIAPIHPLVSGAAQFNTAMVTALRELGPVEALSWRRLYPPLIHRRDTHDRVSRPARLEQAETLLDWADPRTWRAALGRIASVGARAMVLPWLHPVMAPPTGTCCGMRRLGCAASSSATTSRPTSRSAADGG